MEQTALEISREIAHKRIDEICQFEIDLLDVKLEEYLKKSELDFLNLKMIFSGDAFIRSNGGPWIKIIQFK